MPAHFNDLHVRKYPQPTDLVYRGKYIHNWFSNFDAVGHPVTYRGYQTGVLELAFVAAKNPDAIVRGEDGKGDVTFIQRVFTTKRPGDAKRLGAPPQRGGIITPRPDWDYVNIAAMDYFLRQRWQPGCLESDRLVQMPEPIVEWNNWYDNRWGVTINNKLGRNAFGLLMSNISSELATGFVRPGAEECDWLAHQETLVEILNSMQPETIHQPGKVQQAPPPQMSLF